MTWYCNNFELNIGYCSPMAEEMGPTKLSILTFNSVSWLEMSGSEEASKSFLSSSLIDFADAMAGEEC